MIVELTKDSIDLGIVVRDADKALAFYRDTIGLSELSQIPIGGGSKMHRLQCGTSVIKLLHHAKTPPAPPQGGVAGGTGYRYWTMFISNLTDMVKKCADAGYTVAMPVTEMMPGVRFAMIEDPDGNWVEFAQRDQ